MRLITRADWDGLVCAVLLSSVEHIEAIQFAYPKDIQDGKVIVPDNSAIANLPYHPNCVLWFDHHISEEELGAPMAAFTGIKGKFGLAPSAARLIYDYYGGAATLGKFAELVEATDRIDSAQLTEADVVNPQGYVLLAYTVDPRSGLKDLELQMYFIMLIDWLKSKSISEILEIPEVRTMTDRLLAEDQNFRETLRRHSHLDGNVVITDFRGLPAVPPGSPVLAEGATVRNPVDAFVFTRLAAEGWSARPEADRERLLRRVTLDLTGLPPAPEELDAFLADTAPDAYERAVDRLLASPAWGERMALHWLDLARYADTHGYHLDSGREMWLWRDWVIAAFNRNVPFDKFVRDQLAGDLFPQAARDQVIATGFVRNNMINFEGGAIAGLARLHRHQL